MAAEVSPAHPTAPPGPARAASWLHARALWAGLSIITMWLAVLFVGIFGGDFVSSNNNGFTRFPVVVILLPFVLTATIVIGRRGFSGASGEWHGAPDEETQARVEATTEATSLRARLA
jgi:hypothetical protein